MCTRQHTRQRGTYSMFFVPLRFASRMRFPASCTHLRTTGLPSSSRYAPCRASYCWLIEPYHAPSLQATPSLYIAGIHLADGHVSREPVHTPICSAYSFPTPRPFRQPEQRLHNAEHIRVRTTPRFIFCGLGSAWKASLIPRMGSLGAASTCENQVAIVLVELLSWRPLKPAIRFRTDIGALFDKSERGG